MVIAETAISSGRAVGSIRPRSMTTEVSMRPRRWRSGSGTRRGALIRKAVDIAAETIGVHPGRAGEGGAHGGSSDEASPPKRCQLADGNPVSGDDKRLAPIEFAHDVTT